MVAGGLAIMKQLFRDQLSNTELVARLLETADNNGEYADRSVYGRGLMDLRAATSPVGVLDVPVTSQVGNLSDGLQETRVQFGPAFGDGLNQSFASQEIAACDALGVPFWLSLGDLAASSSGPSIRAELGEFMAPASALLNTPALDLGFMTGMFQTGRDAASTRWRLGLETPPSTEAAIWRSPSMP